MGSRSPAPSNDSSSLCPSSTRRQVSTPASRPVWRPSGSPSAPAAPAHKAINIASRILLEGELDAVVDGQGAGDERDEVELVDLDHGALGLFELAGAADDGAAAGHGGDDLEGRIERLLEDAVGHHVADDGEQ